MDGGLWNFENHVLLMERITPGKDSMQIPLFHLNLWIQVYNIPVGFMSEFMAKRIVEKIGKHVETDVNNFTGIRRTYMRIRVGIDVRRPLKATLNLRVSGGESVTVTMKYERLPMYCYICGKLGHGEKFCPNQYDSKEPLN